MFTGVVALWISSERRRVRAGLGFVERSRRRRPGGMVPELRAARLKEIAERVRGEFAGDLSAGRILLFAGIAPVAAVPSNCPHVLMRMLGGPEDYGAAYRAPQRAIAAEVVENFEARQRAYLLLKRHGQEIRKRAGSRGRRAARA